VRRGFAPPVAVKKGGLRPSFGLGPFTASAEDSNFGSSFVTSRQESNLMARRFLISQDSPALYITIVTKDRLPVFQSAKLKDVLCSAIDEARKTAGLLLFAYVLMPDHMHILTSRPSTTSEVLRVLKGVTARRIIDYLKVHSHLSSLAKLQHAERERNYRHSLWQIEKNVLPVFSEGMFMEKVSYIHQNPVRAGLVQLAEEYLWSSVRVWKGCQSEREPLQLDKDIIQWRRSIRSR
jgi:REP-associated tyrosine transposase